MSDDRGDDQPVRPGATEGPATEAMTAARFSRREDAASAFVELVDALVGDFDVVETLSVLSTRSVELLGAAAAGILLADADGALRVVGASNEGSRLLALMQVQNQAGPCVDSYRTGAVISNPDLSGVSPWPRFAAASVAQGFHSVCAVPLRLREFRLGCLNLFMTDPIALPDSDVVLAQALADVASITIMLDQSARDSEVRVGQLQSALESRVVIEQAKGMIAQYEGIRMDAAFARLRSHARNNNMRMADLAAKVADGTISLLSMKSPPPPGRR